MTIEEIKKLKTQLYQIATKYHIRTIFVFGSVARGESNDTSDIDFLIELDDNASAFGIGGFQYEVQQLLGINIDVIPTFALPMVDDHTFVQSVQSEAIAL